MNEAERAALKVWPENGGYNDAPAYLRPYFRSLHRLGFLDAEGRLAAAGRAERAK